MSSNLRILVRRDIPLLLRRGLGAVLVTASVLALVLAAQAVIGGGLTRLNENLTSSSALTLVEISTISPGATNTIDAKSLRDIAAVDGVERVDAWYQVPLSLAPEQWPDSSVHAGEISATPWLPEQAPGITAGEVPSTGPGLGEIVLPQGVQGGTTDALVGQSVTLEYTRRLAQGLGELGHVTLRVVAIADNSVPGMAGPQPAYVSPEQLTNLAAEAGFGLEDGVATRGFVKVRSSDVVPAVQQRLSSMGFGVDSVSSRMESLGGIFQLLRTVTWLFVAVAALVALVAGSSVGNMWVRSRSRDIGVLRAMGFSRADVRRTVVTELAIYGLLTGLLSVVIGAPAAWVATTVLARQNLEILPVASGQVPPWWMLLAVLVGVPMCTVLGGLRAAMTASSSDPDEVLRSE